MEKRIVDMNPIIKDLAERCLLARGLECSILGNVIDRLREAIALRKTDCCTQK